jgi:hypothetical protein
MSRRRATRLLATAGTVAAAAFGGGAMPASASTPVSPTGSAVLRQAGDGWELLSLDGSVLFEAHGRAARTQCLRQARALGTLRILS